VLAAVGFTRRSRSVVVAAETVSISLLGGLLGLGLGVLGIEVTNLVAADRLGTAAIAVFDPILIGYALVVAVVIGLLGAIYPVVLARRTDVLEVLSE
jgi:putative ABC transport system permease protein